MNAAANFIPYNPFVFIRDVSASATCNSRPRRNTILYFTKDEFRSFALDNNNRALALLAVADDRSAPLDGERSAAGHLDIAFESTVNGKSVALTVSAEGQRTVSIGNLFTSFNLMVRISDEIFTSRGVLLIWLLGGNGNTLVALIRHILLVTGTLAGDFYFMGHHLDAVDGNDLAFDSLVTLGRIGASLGGCIPFSICGDFLAFSGSVIARFGKDGLVGNVVLRPVGDADLRDESDNE